MINILNLLLLIFFVTSCGVKGDPVAPGIPGEIGRGQPTYKKAAQKIKVKTNQRVADEDEEEEQSKEDNDER